MKKFFCVLFSVSLLIGTLWGCGKSSVSPRSASAALSESESESESYAVETIESETEPVFSFGRRIVKWDPYAFSEIFTDIFGADAETDFRNIVRSVLRREETCPYKCRAFIDEFSIAVGDIFPLMDPLAGFCMDDDRLYFDYYLSQTEHDALVKAFGAEIERIIAEGCCDCDSPLAASISLYYDLSQIFTYDAAASETEELPDVSAYRAIIKKTGICQSFAGAYAYLTTQLGIPGISCCGDCGDAGHAWTVLKIDGLLYHADVTFENAFGGRGVHFFGMSNEVRAADCSVDTFNIMNRLWHEEVNAHSERFEKLRLIVEIKDMERRMDGMHITGFDENGQLIEVLV